MNYIVSATTDIGTTKENNQDSFNVRVLQTPLGKMVFAVLCDGMGGLSKGEVASATVVNAFCNWVEKRLPQLCRTGIEDNIIRKDWLDVVSEYNEKIRLYGKSCNVSMGTTVTAMLLTQTRYYIINIGDTRAYEITDNIKQITKDHTVVAKEVEMGVLKEEDAEKDPRRSVLLQCVGASEEIYPDLFFGDTVQGAVYMLCTDGFRHEIKKDELLQYLNPSVMLSAEGMKQNVEMLIELNKQREERDNISVVTVRTF